MGDKAVDYVVISNKAGVSYTIPEKTFLKSKEMYAKSGFTLQENKVKAEQVFTKKATKDVSINSRS